MKLSSKSNNPRNIAKELATATNKRLNYSDQFNTFVARLTVAAGATGALPNQLKSLQGGKVVPGTWKVMDATGAPAGALGKSAAAPWTKDRIFLKNYGATDGVFLIRFFEKAPDEHNI